ncbi:polyphosphate--glucose phosphotransferase [Fodinibius salsisoli]|uniref:ROK family protein n=1 Tax=Fodinibius salsisoli TaxID=2820877 RepID=A0ABT3PI92_9BACT|nr:ROK family protein [Fodinibius salsisoli]MCW9705473.1 ROK family protein [Fodinibius salsisoli]
MEVLGIDIGSYGIKGATVDTQQGKILSDRISTPPLEDTTPHKVLAQIHQVVRKEFQWNGPVGCAFPAAVSKGIVLSGKRINDSWVDANAEQLFAEITDNPVSVINDTDATGLAEIYFGAGKHQTGSTIVLTVGAEIGSSLFIGQQLVPNTELGLIEIQGQTVEKHASNETREKGGFPKKTWASRLQVVLEHFEKIFHPDLFIIGGEISRKTNKIFPFIKINTPFKPTSFQNDASIVGAAMVAAQKKKEGVLFGQ